MKRCRPDCPTARPGFFMLNRHMNQLDGVICLLYHVHSIGISFNSVFQACCFSDGRVGGWGTHFLGHQGLLLKWPAKRPPPHLPGRLRRVSMCSLTSILAERGRAPAWHWMACTATEAVEEASAVGACKALPRKEDRAVLGAPSCCQPCLPASPDLTE